MPFAISASVLDTGGKQEKASSETYTDLFAVHPFSFSSLYYTAKG